MFICPHCGKPSEAPQKVPEPARKPDLSMIDPGGTCERCERHCGDCGGVMYHRPSRMWLCDDCWKDNT